ncbi:MAG: AsmA-like C-terminal region-containing protein [Candidatus Binatia bacterium]
MFIETLPSRERRIDVANTERGSIAGKLLLVSAMLVLVLLIAVPLILTQLLFDAGWVNSNLMPALRERLGREIRVEKIEFSRGSLFLKGVEIADDPAFVFKQGDVFLSADELALGLQLPALLERRVVIDRVKIKGARLAIKRDRFGRYNHDSLYRHAGGFLKLLSDKGIAPEPAPRGAPDFVIRQVSFEDCVVVLSQIGEQGVGVARLDEVQARVRLLHGGEGTEFAVSGQVSVMGANPSRFDVEGTILAERARATLAVELEHLDLDRSAEFLKATHSGWAERQRDTRSALAVAPDALRVRAMVSVNRVTSGGLSLSGAVSAVQWERSRIKVRGMEANVAGSRVHGEADVFIEDGTVRYEGQLSLRSASFGELAPALFGPHWSTQKGQADLDLSLSGTGSLRSAALSIDLELNSLDIDAMARARKKSPPPPGKDPRESPLRVSGNYRVSSFRVLGVELTEVRGKGTYSRGNLDLNEIEATNSSGKLTGEGHLYFSPEKLVYNATADLEDASLSELFGRYLPESWGRMDGRCTLEAELSGTVSETVRATDTLKVEGKLTIASGRFSDSSLLKRLSKSTGIRELAELRLSESGGTFTISGGRLSSPLFVLGDPSARLAYTGSVGFDETLDCELWVGIGPDSERKLLSTGILLPYLKDSAGWTYIPVTVTGTFKDPDLSINRRALVSTVINIIPDVTGRILKEGAQATGAILKSGKQATGTVLEKGARVTGKIVSEGGDSLTSVLKQFGRVIGIEKRKRPLRRNSNK